MYLKDCWQVAAYSREIVPGRMLARTLCGVPLILFRGTNGKVTAMEDRCAHRSSPLSKGSIHGDVVRCGYHGMEFNLTGKCVRIPGQNFIPPKARVDVYPVAERYHFAWIWLGDVAKADPALIPDVHWMDDPQWIASQGYHLIGANYKLLNDNLLDLSHETYVHQKTIGNEAVADTPVTTRWDQNAVFVTKEIESCLPPPLYQYLARVSHDTPVRRWQRTAYRPPGYVVIDVGVEPIGDVPGSNRVEGRVINLSTPATESTSHYFWAFARNFRLNEPEVTEFLRYNVMATFDEDREMLEAQQARLGSTDADPANRVAVKADQGAVQGRRLLQSLIDTEAGQGVAA